MSNKAPTVRGRVRGLMLMQDRPTAMRRYRSVLSGEGLLLTREPTNPVDPNAIIVATETGDIGYLERAAAAQIAPWIDKGWVYTCTCVVQAQSIRKGRTILIRRDSLGVRCVPVAPIVRSRVARRTRQLEATE